MKTIDESLGEEIIHGILGHGLLQFSFANPFTYASGLKGPIYVDNRKVLGLPKLRSLVIKGFLQLIERNQIEFDQIAGLATAGIPHASFMAYELNRPMCYVRSSKKAHGQGNQVEGLISEGERIILVEDLINQGSSLNNVLDALEKFKIEACLCIMDYLTPNSLKLRNSWGFPVYSLTNLDLLGMMALKNQLITPENLESLKKWREKPDKWTKV